MKTFLLIISCSLVSSLPAQPPDVLWSQRFGSPGISEHLTAMSLLPNDQIVLAGQTSSGFWGSTIIWLSSGGDILAQSQNDHYNIHALATFRGGLAVARLGIIEYMHEQITTGCVEIVDSNRIGMYPICDTSPEFAWLPFCAFHAVTVINSDTLLFCGEAVSNVSDIGYWLHWTSGDGREVNSRFYAVNGKAAAVQANAAGTLVVGTITFDSRPAWGILRTDANGDSLWFRSFNATTFSEARAVLKLRDGGFLIAGAITGDQDSPQAALLRINENGDSLWTRTYGGAGSAFNALLAVTNGDVVAAGYTSAYGHGGQDFLLFKITSDGDSVWSTTYGGAGDEICNSLGLAYDSEYLLAGTTTSFDTLGTDWWVVRTEADLATAQPQPFPLIASLHQNYPNPFNPTTEIRFELAHESHILLRVFNLAGREVETIMDREMSAGTHTATFDAKHLPSGLYFYRLEVGGYSETKKMILLK